MKIVHIIDGPLPMPDEVKTTFNGKSYIETVETSEKVTFSCLSISDEEEMGTIELQITGFKLMYSFINYFKNNVEPMTEDMFIELQETSEGFGVKYDS